MQQDLTKSVFRGAASFFSGTFLSRITGLGRDMAMAFCFGSHPMIASFMVAFRLANFFRRMVGEGPLPSGFIPYFEVIRKDSPKEGACFFRDVLSSFSLVCLGVLLLGEGVLWLLSSSGLVGDVWKEILRLTLFMMPAVLFLCLYGITSALLQCERKFFLSSFSPVLFNTTWIIGVVLLRNKDPSEAVWGLSLAVVIGFFLQWAVLLPSLGKYLKTFLSTQEIVRFQFFPKKVQEVVKPFFLGLAGIAAVQINSAFDAIFARIASAEGPAYLWYAIRIEQLPLALFGVALSSALLPPLSKALSEGREEAFFHLLQVSFRRAFSFIIPCTAALFLLAFSGINLLYGRGDFSPEATKQTLFCLWGYGLGLPSAVLTLLLAPAFYSHKNFKVPMWACFASVLCNGVLNALFVFVFHLGAVSIALATSISSWLNFFWLMRALQKKHPNLPPLYSGMKKIALCTGVSMASAFTIGTFWLQDPSLLLLAGGSSSLIARGFLEQAGQFLGLLVLFMVFLIGFAFLLQARELLELLPQKRKPEKEC